MIITILRYALFSPLLPMIYLLFKYFEAGANRIVISLIMLAVCAASLFLGYLYVDHAHGMDGFNALGAVWGGFGGIIISVILLIVSIIREIHF